MKRKHDNYKMGFLLFCILTGLGMISCSDDDEGAILKRNADSIEFSYLQTTKDLTILANGGWQIKSNNSWISLTPEEGLGDGTTETPIHITAEQNIGDERVGSVTLSNSERSYDITIRQENGHLSFKKATMPSSFLINQFVSGMIQIPYTKGSVADKASVRVELEGPGAAGLTVADVVDYQLSAGDGVIPLSITGTPTASGAIEVNLYVDVSSRNISDSLFVVKSRTKITEEDIDPLESPTVKMFKLLPRLAVLDWGDYENGKGDYGANGTSRNFTLELAETKYGAAIRRYHNQVNWLSSTSTVALPTFYEHNRFAFADLTPNTTYWFRIVVKSLNTKEHLDSDMAYFEFKTPAEETLTSKVLIYKDFDNFWFGGNPIYQAFAVMPTGAQIKGNLDPSSDVVKSTDYRTVHPMNTPGDTYTAANLSPANCPAMWNYYWQGDLYGADYLSSDYVGWQGKLVCLNTGCIRLSSASAQGYIKTPLLAGLGSSTSDIVVTVHTAPYFEPYHSWGEDHLQHFIIVEGPGTIIDGGATKSEPANPDPSCANTDKQVTVICSSNVNPSTRGPSNDYTIPTKHVVKISGATKDTRVVVKTHPYYGGAHYRIIVDDIKVEIAN